MSPFIQAAYLVTQTLFDIYLFALLLRFLFQVVRADFYNPLSQLVVKVTNPPLKPLRRLIPGLWGIDWACLMICTILGMLKLSLLFWIQLQKMPGPLGLFVWTLGDLTKMTLYLFFFSILIQAVLSWVNPYGNHPLQALLSQITSPFMRPFRRFIPPIAGFDITPIFAILLIQVMIILIAGPIIQYGTRWAL